METRIIFIVLLIAPPPNPIPDQVSSELMLSENMIGDMSGNEELLSNKAKKTQMTQKADRWTWLVKVTNTQQQSQDHTSLSLLKAINT